MKKNWILLFLAAGVFAGCDTPKVEEYKFTPPPMPDTSIPPRDEKSRQEFEDRLRETMKLLQCKEAVAAKIKLNGNFDDKKVKDLSGGKVLPGVSHPASFNEAAGAKGQLLHNGCPEDLLAAEAGGLEVKLIENGVAAAQKVLLCGQVTKMPFLMVTAAELVLKDVNYKTAAVGRISIKTGALKLIGENKLTATSISGSFITMNIEEFMVHVETGIFGPGKLEVDSKTVTCEEIRAREKQATP